MDETDWCITTIAEVRVRRRYYVTARGEEQAREKFKAAEWEDEDEDGYETLSERIVSVEPN